MRKIPLTQGKFAIVDDNDFDYLNQFTWYAQKHRNIFYAGRRDRIKGKKIMIAMHRFLLKASEKQQVDHMDGDGLNNQRNNLRIATPQQNASNKKRRKDNTSGYKGVYCNTDTKKWIASIKVNYKGIYLGAFNDPETAALAYNQAAIKHFGEFAYLNNIILH